MPVEIAVTYHGNTNCTAMHEPSNSVLKTTAPKDNGGDGSNFSPTDLLATALGTCMTTIMAMAATKHGIELKGVTARVEKHMSPEPPRRVVKLPVVITVPVKVDVSKRAALESAARNCPVAVTLGNQVEMPITFHWA